MKYSIEKNEKFTIFKIDDEKLDSIVSPELKSEFVKLNTSGDRNIILDLEKVKFVDSSGLSSILVGNRLCNNAGGKLVLSSLTDHVDKLLTISQLKTVFEIVQNINDAKEYMFLSSLGQDSNSDDTEEDEEDED